MPSRETRHWKHLAENQQLRQVRKQIKRKREPDRVRTNDWTPEGLTDPRELDELNTDELWDSPQSERVLPRGERERRKAALQRVMLTQADQEPRAEQASTAELHGARGTVVEVSSGVCRVALDGRELICGLRGALSAEETGYTNVVAVGDRVVVEESGPGQGVVQAVLPRRSVLARPDVYDAHLQQVIVANADQLLVVASWREPAIWLELIDRFLIAAQRNGLQPSVCVNKIDLAENLAACREELRPYLELGYRVVFASALCGEGVDELRELLRGHTTVLAGLSGVGKSSLLRAVQPGLTLRIGAVSERHHAGKHITTQVNLLPLEMGGYVADTPGIREFGLAGLHKDELAEYYPEIAAQGLECRYSDCMHADEPDCRVRAALGKGLVHAARYHNYLKIVAELPE